MLPAADSLHAPLPAPGLRTIRTERRWQAITPTIIGAGSIALGAAGDDALALPGAVLGLASSLAPIVATRRNRQRDAAYLFFLANRRARERTPTAHR
ncbi:hypothetical protein ACWKSP_40145 [Micromonosporaceae bacterium Da 78-11]